VIAAEDKRNIYRVPLALHAQDLDGIVLDHFGISAPPADLSEWNALADRVDNLSGAVRIAVVGKYVQLQDAYLSVVEALRHGGIHHGVEVEFDFVDSESLSPEEAERHLECADGILIPGGFGVRGIEGKIQAARYARERGVPFLGVCLGMQVATIEFARHVCGLHGANSTEFDPDTPYPIVDLLPEQHDVRAMGGTMRLGAEPVVVRPGTKAEEAYGQELIYERHRHRYEVSNALRPRLEERGLVISGVYAGKDLVEILELPDHPWFVASQFHPEFKSRPTKASPLFRDFVGAAALRAGLDGATTAIPVEAHG
jgi:CTP synthase